MLRTTQSNRFPTTGRIIQTFRPYWWRVLLIIVMILINSTLGTAVVPEVTKMIIDQAFLRKDVTLLAWLVLALIVLPMFTGVVSIALDYVGITLAQYVMHDLRIGLYARLQAVALRFYSSERTGEIISRLTNDINGVSDVLSNGLSGTLSHSIGMLTTLLVMLSLNVPLTLLSLGLTPIFVSLAVRVGAVLRGASKEKQQTLADVLSVLEETLNVSGALLVKSFGRQRAETTRFKALSERLVTIQVRQTMVGRWFLLSFHLFFNIVPALVYYFGGLQVMGGRLSPGSLIAFIALQSQFFPTLRQLLSIPLDIQSALSLFERLFAYLDLPIEIADCSNARALDHVAGHIRFHHVSFCYQPEQPALIDIDFAVQPGQLVALVGPSGAGKSTTACLLPRFYDVGQGAVEIDGHDVRSVTQESLLQHIGIVTQETYLLHTTIRENIAYGRPGAADEEVIAAAQAAQIHERILQLPNGYETVVGPRGYVLSGGEKQRVAIARVLLKNPRILILDEATSALDTRSERLLQAALAELQMGRTTLAIAHRLSTILSADQILVMNAGRIVERGTHAELLQQGGLYSQYYDEQLKSR
ncbi:ABC transporter ATP-binding protein [Tengunoibacter tsumagoiensis]|uniref:Multidrug ABC transporter ATP-binding protein n=1 Tax=Tengunoibacter tsumagoiensis TaxID=2014871 RepID=A0A402A8U7_9CHLR|nr:ABC transporter ATP-binding protein [Tengunoibacter tsumagoiensis]GCE15539.1 multidrug ABC transporter ATP-binding protein [Tengunoibacter tsumagoiensis]